MSVPSPMPSACTPMRLISSPSSQRASYSRNPVGFTSGSDSYAYVFGFSAAFGLGNIWSSTVRPPEDIAQCAKAGKRSLLEDELALLVRPAHARQERHAEEVHRQRLVGNDQRRHVAHDDVADL